MKKLLCILHRTPPVHGAGKVGDFIHASQVLKENYKCKFITIRSSDELGDIGKFSVRKFYLFIELYLKVAWALLTFRPNKIYYTASVSGIAFYRDLFLSTLWKFYRTFKQTDVYYHYHTKGVNQFVSSSDFKHKLTTFFVRKVKVILLSPLLKNDFSKVHSMDATLYLPNGVEDNFTGAEFDYHLENKQAYRDGSINVLFLSNMIRSKGFFEVLKLARDSKRDKIKFHFAGSWKDKKDEELFRSFIEENKLDKKVTFHGFVDAERKDGILRGSDILVFPTTCESFGLVIVEALSYGLPVIATSEGSIPYILDKKCGVIADSDEDLINALDYTIGNLVNEDASQYCRKRYIEHFSLEVFEKNLVKVFD